MNLNILRDGFLDELSKIALVETTGLSPETMLNQKSPAPMETAGSRKAIEILDRAESIKQGSISSPAMQLRTSQKIARPLLGRAKRGPSIKSQIRGTLIGLKGTLPPR